MTHACRTALGNYINGKRCASHLQDPHTRSHDQAITSVSVSMIYLASSLGLDQGWIKRNYHTVFESLPLLSTTPWLNLHSVPLMLNVKQGSCEYQFLKSFGMTRQGNEPSSTDCKADALTTTPSLSPLHHHCSIKRCRTHKPQCTNIDKKMTVLSSGTCSKFFSVVKDAYISAVFYTGLL